MKKTGLRPNQNPRRKDELTGDETKTMTPPRGLSTTQKRKKDPKPQRQRHALSRNQLSSPTETKRPARNLSRASHIPSAPTVPGDERRYHTKLLSLASVKVQHEVNHATREASVRHDAAPTKSQSCDDQEPTEGCQARVAPVPFVNTLKPLVGSAIPGAKSCKEEVCGAQSGIQRSRADAKILCPRRQLSGGVLRGVRFLCHACLGARLQEALNELNDTTWVCSRFQVRVHGQQSPAASAAVARVRRSCTQSDKPCLTVWTMGPSPLQGVVLEHATGVHDLGAVWLPSQKSHQQPSENYQNNLSSK